MDVRKDGDNMAKELPRNKDGKKMYPVCSWERNQHKIYNAHERAWVRLYQARENGTPEEESEAKKAYDYAMIAYNAFDACVRDGIVYATWDEGKVIKDLIAGYDFRH